MCVVRPEHRRALPDPTYRRTVLLGLNCNVEMVPVMVAEDLARASEAFPRIIETYA
jgi:hypothetical protein